MRDIKAGDRIQMNVVVIYDLTGEVAHNNMKATVQEHPLNRSKLIFRFDDMSWGDPVDYNERDWYVITA